MSDITPEYIPAHRWVAHRGDPARFPENSHAGISAALQAGATFVEFDIQLSKDREAFLLHDERLNRTTGIDKSIFELDAGELENIFLTTADGTTGECIPSLKSAVQLLNSYPESRPFIELKTESIRQFGYDACLAAIVQALNSARFQWIFISFDLDCVTRFRAEFTTPVGWVLKTHDRASLEQARKLAPEFLFCSKRKLPPKQLVRGVWQWVIYDINEVRLAAELLSRGAGLIETSCISKMLSLAQS